ncbi:MAG: hypothetical protein IPI30_12435 [Saprospiraceae bacterium]|nr:hypothetical protein [Candidatus Vicinibacter affinis]
MGCLWVGLFILRGTIFVDNGCNFTFFKKFIAVGMLKTRLVIEEFCVDTICIYTPTAIDIVYQEIMMALIMPTFIVEMFFQTPNGNPSIIHGTSYVPILFDAECILQDLKIPICPNTFKILRRWVILDWCSGDIWITIRSLRW